MVVLRLKRIGTTKKAYYRIVATDSRNPRDGRFIEEIGTYDPKKKPAAITVKRERADYWLTVGAKPSPAVKRLLEKAANQK